MKSVRKARSVFNNRGSAFVQALVAVGVVGVMIYFLSPTVIKHKTQVTKTASIITARLALHSMVDYTLFGIRQRWCFSESWMQESCGKSVPATAVELLSHPRSVERILMKKETVDFLRLIGIANPEKVPVSKIHQRINIESFSALHPVYKIVADLKGYTVASIDVEISRDVRASIPEYGREVYLRIDVSLLDRSGKVIEVGSSTLKTTSYVGVYPREVGSFAVMVAGDLYLDKTSNSTSGLKKGDALIKQTGSRLANIKYPGLIFESPVFVNGSIHLPMAPDSGADLTGGDTVYTPVTFKDKVVLGDGPVMRNNQEFKPRYAGQQDDQFWAQIRQFGGFQKGVEVDGARDLGLDYLSGFATGETVNASLMAQCLRHEKIKYELSNTENSQLTGQLLGQKGSKYNYRLALTDGNMFTVQNKDVEKPNSPDNWWGFRDLLKGFSLSQEKLAATRYNIKFGNMYLTGEIPAEGSVTLEPKIDLRPLEKSLERQTSQAESDVNSSQARLNQAARSVERAARDVNDAESAVDREERRNPVDKDRLARARSNLYSARNDLAQAKQYKDRMEAELDANERKLSATREQLRKVRASMDIQPKIHISMKKPLKPGDDPEKNNSNASFQDLDISFDNASMLVNSMGERLPVSLELVAYDVGYYDGRNLRKNWAAGNNKGWLVFEPDGADFKVGSRLQDSSGRAKSGYPEDVDPYINLDKACEALGKSSSAFGGSDWSQSFASSARQSWSFTAKYGEAKDFVFDRNNAYWDNSGGSTAAFQVVSLAKTCYIKSDANFVSGFMNCEKLVIESRDKPLRIVGSFILSQGMSIDDSAYRSGIRWSTIYHAMATYELRKAGVLKGNNSADCSVINRYPVWHPYPSITDVSNLYRCNAISLRAKADPFRWTSVDPDCGFIKNGNSTVCKNRLVRFYVLEISRESGI
ncbi:type III secretion protein [Bdellovibrio bacteriovorus]|uniref:type III secretion protein n=1 Tax=Bdellovibrio bacteriovorus TaxID=959 RepID=UPI0021CE8E03|nr:type III secretion protein [Bdellovibrio bacteriovorus]UXR66160.1 type III secretion protein [Bdellovibrio bacteriovorus]